MAKFNNVYNVCGKNLCKIRTIQNLSQADLARKAQLEGLNVDKKTISLIEMGSVAFKIMKFFALQGLWVSRHPTFWKEFQKRRADCVRIKNDLGRMSIAVFHDLHCRGVKKVHDYF